MIRGKGRSRNGTQTERRVREAAKREYLLSQKHRWAHVLKKELVEELSLEMWYRGLYLEKFSLLEVMRDTKSLIVQLRKDNVPQSP